MPDRTTTIVVGVSKTAAAGVIAVLRDLGLCFDLGLCCAGRGGARSALYVENAASLSGRRALRRFPAPRLVVISHDPVALIEELGETAKDTRLGLARAKDRIDLVFKIALRSNCPVLVLSHSLARGSLRAARCCCSLLRDRRDVSVVAAGG